MTISLKIVAQSSINWRAEIAICLDEAFDYPESDKAINDLLACLKNSEEHLGHEDSLTALICHKIGVRYYSDLSDYTMAHDYWKQAFDIRLALYKENTNHIDLGMSYRNLGIIYGKHLYQFKKGISYLIKSIEMFQYLKKRENLVKDNYLEVGNIYASRGNTKNMMDYYTLHLELVKESTNSDTIEWATALLSLGTGINWLENPLFSNKALFYINQSLALFQKQPDNNQLNIAECYLEMCIAQVIAENFEEAETSGIEALNLYAQSDTIMAMVVLSNLSIVYNELRQFSKAKNALSKAIKISKKNGYDEYLAANYDNLGTTFFYQNQLDSAQKYYQQAITNTIHNYHNPDSNHNPNLSDTSLIILSKPDLLTYLSDKAKAQQQNQQQKNALSTYQTADHLLTLLKQDLQTQQSQLHWREKATPIYEQATAVAHQLYKTTNDRRYLEQMLQFSEKSKASILYDAVVEVQAKHHIIPKVYIEQEQQIKIKLGEYERKVVNHPNDPAALEHLIQYRQEHHSFIEMLEDSFPDYYTLKYQAAALDIKNIQQSLLKDEKTALLEYFVSDTLIYLFVLTQEDLDLHTFPKHIFYENKTVSLDTFITQFHQVLSVEGRGDLYLNKAYALYQTWLAPALKKLPKTVDRLIIIPDDKFHYVPFEGLLTAAPLKDTVLYKNLEYLLYDYQFTYAYSASLLQQVQHQTVKSKFPFLGFAPSFRNLVYNQYSVTNINNMIGGKIYTDGGNNKDTLINWKDNVQVLHFGTHAAMNDKEPLNCQIWIDNLQSITTAEIYNLPIKTELVVLSACQTGIGQVRKGEGMMSLSRAFMYSGSPSVVASLWAVDDEKTEQLMDFFYKNLKKGLDKDKALHQAKLDYLTVGRTLEKDQAYFNPYYWSAFIAIGNTAAIDFPLYEDLLFGWKTTYWMILMGMGFLIGCFFLGKRKRKSTSH